MANFLDTFGMNNFHNFFIYTENGNLIYKLSTDENIDSSIQGILQAMYFTGEDYSFKLRTLSTDSGVLGFKLFDYIKFTASSNKNKPFPPKANAESNSDLNNLSEKNILLCLVFPNYFGDEDLSDLIIERILNYIFDILIVHIGCIDLFSTNLQEIEKLKRQLELFQPSVEYILKNFSNFDFLFKAEKKLEVSKEILYPIKHYMEQIKNGMKLDFLCLLDNNSVVWASNDWLSIDISDRLLFILISRLYSEIGNFNEFPVYFSETKLEDNSTGHNAYKLFTINLYENMKLLLICDSSFTISKIKEGILHKYLDEFFITRILNFRNEIKLNNPIVDNIAKSMILINNNLKTYKIMIDDSLAYIEAFRNFILNSHLSNYILRKNSEFEEFYLKNEEFTFYFFKISFVSVLILFDKDITFDDINNVKVTLRTYIDQYENKDNYIESEHKN